MNYTELLNESKTLALDIINLYKYLTEIAERKESILSKKLLISGTSIGNDIRQEQLLDAFHSAASAHYWLTLLQDGEYLDYGRIADIEIRLMSLKTTLYELSHNQK